MKTALIILLLATRAFADSPPMFAGASYENRIDEHGFNFVVGVPFGGYF